MWNTRSLTAMSEAVPGSSFKHSEDANTLLIVLSFFSTSEKIPLDLLPRGAAPRKRWTEQGVVVQVDAIRDGLVPELCSLLLDMPRLSEALQELESSASIVLDSKEIYTLNEAVANCVCKKLSAEHFSFWKCQALIVTYRAVPWKYLESAIPNVTLFLPHFQQALQVFQGRFEILLASTRADLVLTLIEASRFPNMAWKRFAIGQAAVAASDLEDTYLNSCIAQSQSLLGRITGDMGQAVSGLANLSEGRLSSTVSKKMHSGIGQATIQQSLNCVQVEDISTAKRLLESWSPINQPSPIEEIVLFRKDIVEERRVLNFDEDLRDFTCELANTLRELDDPASAERYLQAEITRRNCKHFEEAEIICLEVQSCPNLLKFEKLRLHITMAKIRHIKSDNEGVLSCWSAAMQAIGKYHLANGRLTRIIVLSICDTLRRMGQNWLADASLKEAESLDKLATPGGTRYWIAGMRHWLEYLQYRGRHSRM
ncbi:hypothetical protein K505DRAFT_354071 [Melanomma pulvis-pyrius CBS 109.77]|uniref:Uncharacterized protein n=1 Tax=Melanomma pulvis-pyrius CBS 109.77 TaxID=1314802 RepID=A0A6A6WT25_9PLEO|nr:hypothetical protein K505DRAFT_354071 [Melanomma pulvis-pyrius CBS 109.77]